MNNGLWKRSSELDTGKQHRQIFKQIRKVGLVSLVLCGSIGGNPSQATPVSGDWKPVISGNWKVGDATEAGFDQAALDKLVMNIHNGQFANTHAVLIEHDGELVFERYFSGRDEEWGRPTGVRNFELYSLHDVRSISKSVTSLLLGIALTDDVKQAVSKPAVNFLPDMELETTARKITLHQLMTMTAGFQWNEMTTPYNSSNDEVRLYRQRNPAHYVMSRPLVSKPGSAWYYNGGTTQVLASMITELTGKRLDAYARDKLFEPLGVTEFEWHGPGRWTPDNPAAMSGLRLKARDLAKIGSVFLHDGKWGEHQIVPKEWVDISSVRHVKDVGDWSDNGVWGYGYQWWVGDLRSGERVIAGFGNGNQRLFVIPKKRLVITINAGDYNLFTGQSERILQTVLQALD
ncbi:serine hydrolase domain-containing protein [Photobacterium frigidiphilum]|nr:serine hydrolase [Photobacterium frigidiphilum]